jgi:hypothetical protein
MNFEYPAHMNAFCKVEIERGKVELIATERLLPTCTMLFTIEGKAGVLPGIMPVLGIEQFFMKEERVQYLPSFLSGMWNGFCDTSAMLGKIELQCVVLMCEGMATRSKDIRPSKDPAAWKVIMFNVYFIDHVDSFIMRCDKDAGCIAVGEPVKSPGVAKGFLLSDLFPRVTNQF